MRTHIKWLFPLFLVGIYVLTRAAVFYPPSNSGSGGVGGTTNGASTNALAFLETDGTTNFWSFNGASLTNLNASELRSGTVPTARLPSLSTTYIATSSGTGTNLTVKGITGTNDTTGNWWQMTNGVETITISNAPNVGQFGIVLTNNVVAASGNQQYSPSIGLFGNGWKTTATAASQPVGFTMGVVPVQGSANPTSLLIWSNTVNGAAFTEAMRLAGGAFPVLTIPDTVSVPIIDSSPLGTVLTLKSAGTRAVALAPNNNNASFKWAAEGSTRGAFYPQTDNAEDLGEAASRVALLYLSTSVTNGNLTGGGAINFPTAGTGTDAAGADMRINASAGTGTGRGGAVRLQTANSATSTGSTANTLVDRTYISAKRVNLTESSATLVFNVSLASGKYCGLHVFATTHADDATDFQATTDEFVVAAVNKGGTVTAVVSTIGAATTASAASSVSTLTTTWTAVANGNGVDIKNNAVSSLTQTTLAVKWRVELDSDDTTIAVTPQ